MTLKTAIPTLLTADQFASLGDIGRAELVRGRLLHLTKPKPKHGRIAMRIGTAISNFVQKHNLGEVYAAETGFMAGRDPDSVRASDVAFVRAEVVANHNEEDWLPHSPDLAVEVFWVFDPKARAATVYQASGAMRTFKDGDILGDDRVLPGFLFRVSDAFGKITPD